MELNYKHLLVALCIGTVAGYTLKPTKTETKTAEVDHKTDKVNTDVDKHQTTTTTEVVLPDGTKKKTTVTNTDTQTNQTRTDADSSSKTADTTKETGGGASRLSVNLLAGTTFATGQAPALIYGASVSRRLLGPVAVGLFGLTNKTGGFSLGLEL